MRTRYTTTTQLHKQLETERKENEELRTKLKTLREWTFKVVQENKVLEEYITRLETYMEDDYEL